VDIVNRHRGAVRAQGRDGDVAQPDGFFDQGPRAVIFTEQVAGFVVGVQDGAGGAAAGLDPLPEGVVDRCLGGRAVGQGREPTRVVIGGGDGGIARRVARDIVGVRAGKGARDRADPVARG